MSVPKRIGDRLSQVVEESLDTLIKVKDHFWPIKKGEGFERATTPRTREEALSLSILGPNSAIILSVLEGIEDDINLLCGLDDHSLTHTSSNLARAFGSKGGKRMELSFNTIKEAKEVPNFSQQTVRPAPINYGYEDQTQDDN